VQPGLYHYLPMSFGDDTSFFHRIFHRNCELTSNGFIQLFGYFEKTQKDAKDFPKMEIYLQQLFQT